MPRYSFISRENVFAKVNSTDITQHVTKEYDFYDDKLVKAFELNSIQI
jgi:hypothetical protein